MEDKHLENLLFELGNEDIVLPNNLVQNTKEKINNKHFLPIFCMSIFLNLISLIGIIVIVYFRFNLKGIIGLYLLWCFISSLSLLPVVFINTQSKLKSTKTMQGVI
ncbi:hypothetical protein [Clostridium sp.]